MSCGDSDHMIMYGVPEFRCGWWWWWGGCYISIHVSVLCDSVYQKTLLKDVSEMQFEGDIKSAPSEGQLLQLIG